MYAEETFVSNDIVKRYLQSNFLMSDPSIDYVYSRQNIENMVNNTTRTHKNNEEYITMSSIFCTL